MGERHPLPASVYAAVPVAKLKWRNREVTMGFPVPAIEENCEERGGYRAICARRPRR